MSKGTDRRKSSPKSLERSWGKVFMVGVEGTDGAKIVEKDAAIDILKYEAIEKGNEAAMRSLSRFAEMGFDNWVKKVTNFVIEDKQDQIIGLLNEMRVEMKEMKAKVEKLDRLQGTTVRLYPGLHHINEGISIMNPSLLDNNAMYSPRDWLRLKQVELDQPTYRAFSLLVSETYKTLTGKTPSSKYEKVIDNKGKKNSKRVGYGYKVHDFYILEAAFKKLLDKLGAGFNPN